MDFYADINVEITKTTKRTVMLTVKEGVAGAGCVVVSLLESGFAQQMFVFLVQRQAPSQVVELHRHTQGRPELSGAQSRWRDWHEVIECNNL